MYGNASPFKWVVGSSCFFLSALGLTGCNVSKAGLGVSPMSSQTVEGRSTADRAVDMAGGIGAFTAGIGGGMIGGGAGAIGGGLYGL
ncbi:MAG: hypothetical protein NMK33_00230 [Candidatus Cardinium sp.]|uniref:hypothetical protein n=1 Tax=Cardinium endosymbiont of Dermatophagoides farinae TaxID=2597823 RepID=UPI0011846558|nr:hypothetical protein [Cardinium endosymbiont of Dermatophagoides farinae]TSJ80964.1 hypothetical protein FPG78_02910 [Cardinium endosymbiont of Dermatophagoides farinae]UWW96990.1 MAG: hypothetical protein NMK33_00230 [Candidatus Cardinium sp.]